MALAACVSVGLTYGMALSLSLSDTVSSLRRVLEMQQRTRHGGAKCLTEDHDKHKMPVATQNERTRIYMGMQADRSIL